MLNLKKLIYITLPALVMPLASCTVSDGGTLKQLKGTYALSTYVVTDSKKGTTTDKIETNEIKAYFVITGTDRGYYAYSDIYNDMQIKEVSLAYTYDSDKPNAITNVEWRTLVTDRAETVPGGSRENLGFTHRNKQLNFTRPELDLGKLGYTPKTEIKYKKISDKTDLSTVKTLVGTDKYLKYEDYLIDSYFTYLPNYEDDEFAYFVYDIDGINKTATTYSCPIDGGRDSVNITENIPVTYEYSTSTMLGTATIGSRTFTVNSTLMNYVEPANPEDEFPMERNYNFYRTNSKFDLESFLDNIFPVEE